MGGKYWSMGLFPGSAGIFNLTLVNFIKVPGSSFGQPVEVPLNGNRSWVTLPYKGSDGTKAPGTLSSRATDRGWLAPALPASSSTPTLPGVPSHFQGSPADPGHSLCVLKAQGNKAQKWLHKMLCLLAASISCALT